MRRSLLLPLAVWTALALAPALTACAQDTPPAPMPSDGVAEADGVRIHYRLFGADAPDGAVPLLVLNGGPGLSSEHFGGLAARLSALAGGRRTVTFDQRGTGRSTLDRVDATTVTLAAMVADVEALRAHLGVERWVVFGHSWGGMYAMAYATAHPERVAALVLSASGGSDLSWTETFQDDLRARLSPEGRAAYARASTTRERIEAIAPAYVFDPAHVPFVIESLTRPGASVPEVRSLVFEDLFRVGFDLGDALARVEAPALLLHGRQDILPVRVAERTHAALPRSELVLLDECSHYLWLDRPDAYFGAIDRFLREAVG